MLWLASLPHPGHMKDPSFRFHARPRCMPPRRFSPSPIAQGGLDCGLSAAPLGTRVGVSAPWSRLSQVKHVQHCLSQCRGLLHSMQCSQGTCCPPGTELTASKAQLNQTQAPPSRSRHWSRGQRGKDRRRDKYWVRLTWQLPSFGIGGFRKGVTWKPKVVRGLPESAAMASQAEGTRWD